MCEMYGTRMGMGRGRAQSQPPSALFLNLVVRIMNALHSICLSVYLSILCSNLLAVIYFFFSHFLYLFI